MPFDATSASFEESTLGIIYICLYENHNSRTKSMTSTQQENVGGKFDMTITRSWTKHLKYVQPFSLTIPDNFA